MIPARASRGRGADGGATAVVKRHDDSFDAWLAKVLLVVAIQILPDVVTEAGLDGFEAEVDARIVLASGQGDGRATTCGWVAIAVRRVSARICHTEDATIGKCGGHAHGVGAGIEVPEVVVADGIGHRAADGGAATVVERDRDIFDAGLTDFLKAVAIQVLPDVIAE